MSITTRAVRAGLTVTGTGGGGGGIRAPVCQSSVIAANDTAPGFPRQPDTGPIGETSHRSAIGARRRLFLVREEAITDARFGPEVARLLRIRLDLLAETGDVDVQVMGLGAIRWAPDLSQQRLVREDAVGVAHQRLEELVLRRRQVQLLLSESHAPSL